MNEGTYTIKAMPLKESWRKTKEIEVTLFLEVGENKTKMFKGIIPLKVEDGN